MGDAATEPAIATGLEEAAGRPPMPELVPAELWPDPHPHYHRMRAETPVKPFPEWDEFVFTRYADCELALHPHGDGNLFGCMIAPQASAAQS